MSFLAASFPIFAALTSEKGTAFNNKIAKEVNDQISPDLFDWLQPMQKQAPCLE